MRKIQGDDNLSNEQKQTAFTNFFNGLPDDNRFKEMAQDFDILKGSVDKFSEESLVNLYANQIKNTQGFVGARSAIATYNDACKKGEEESNLVAKAIGKTNASLGKHLIACNGAKTSMIKYVGSLALAKAGQLALQFTTMALNAALSVGVSAVLSLVFEAFDKLIVTEEELSDKVDQVTSKFKEQKNELATTKSRLDVLTPEFETLSKGVNSLGENVSLTSDEYSKYGSIVNEIGDMIPSLVTGFNSQGYAILSCKGNVEELTQAYNELTKSANNSVLVEASDIFKNFQNKKDDFEDAGFKYQNMTIDSVKVLKNILNSSDIDKALSLYFVCRFSSAFLLTVVLSTIVGNTPNRFNFGLTVAVICEYKPNNVSNPSIENFCVCTGIRSPSAADIALMSNTPNDGKQSIKI